MSEWSRRTLLRMSSAPFYRKGVPLSPSLTTTSSAALYGSIENNDREQQQEQRLERHLSLTDLLAVGVGGTVGSGLFVLAGLVAHEYAGPAAVLSWGVAGAAAVVSGVCYAELAGRIPLPGSAYAYAYVAMGELPAILAAACLSLEYIVASSAVARSWGDKVVVYLHQQGIVEYDWTFVGNQDSFFNPFACLISTLTVVLLLNGIQESKQITNVFTAVKVALVIFMVVVGMWHVQPDNWTPFIPSQFGVSGIFRGATSTFFGYLGYDQVCGLAGEAIEPKKNLPRAILGTLACVTLLYMIATLTLVGMQPYDEISSVSGFPSAFYALNAGIAGQITALGEILTLPIVLLVTVQVQPRLQLALAEDGLISDWFCKLHNGNLWNGTCFAGALLILFSTFVPFAHLNDMISCAVLSALAISNTSLILMWHEDDSDDETSSTLAEWLVVAFHTCALVTAVTITRFLNCFAGTVIAGLLVVGMIASAYAIYKFCPRATTFGGRRQRFHGDSVQKESSGYFETPLVPFWPCLGIFMNWYLIAQLDFVGIVGLLAFWFLVILYYIFFAVHHSVGGSSAFDPIGSD